MIRRSDVDIAHMVDAVAVEYADEERAAAEEEARAAAASKVFSVRLPPDIYDAVRAAADDVHLTPSALIRQWVTERVEAHGEGDLQGMIAALRRDVERLERLAASA